MNEEQPRWGPPPGYPDAVFLCRADGFPLDAEEGTRWDVWYCAWSSDAAGEALFRVGPGCSGSYVSMKFAESHTPSSLWERKVGIYPVYLAGLLAASRRGILSKIRVALIV